jgi:hypothetical protein
MAGLLGMEREADLHGLGRLGEDAHRTRVIVGIPVSHAKAPVGRRREIRDADLRPARAVDVPLRDDRTRRS